MNNKRPVASDLDEKRLAWNSGLKGYTNKGSFKKGEHHGYGFKKGMIAWNKGNKSMITKECKICGKSFEIEKWIAERYSACENIECRKANKSKENNPNWNPNRIRNCKDCGKSVSGNSTGRCKSCGHKGIGLKSEEHKRMVIRLNNRRRKLKVRGIEGSHTQEEWLQLCKTYHYICLCCKRDDLKLTRDHIVPLDMGGTDYIWNIQPLCGSCNSIKHTKSIDYREELWIN